jgi:hypothetical protein
MMLSKDDTPWYDAPLPSRFHRCTVWSSGIAGGDLIGRCACGAVRIMGGWINKNERRKK